jgi:hypothetical protein
MLCLYRNPPREFCIAADFTRICGIPQQHGNREKAEDWMAAVSQCEPTVPFTSWKGTSHLHAEKNADMIGISGP